MKTKTTHTDKKDMKRTHKNWSDNSNHSLWLIRRKKLQIVVSLGELFLFVAYWSMIPIFFPQIPIFCWSDPDFSYQLSGRSALKSTAVPTRFSTHPLHREPAVENIQGSS